jgi:pimeloyl-ACP methyl ester carboxylesterase
MGRGWKIALAVVAALAMLIGVNAVVTGGESKPAEVTVPGGRILSLQGGDLQVVERGPRDGVPIVLLHCFTCAIDWWDELMPRLAHEHRVIALDMLGHGGSEKPADGYGAENQAAVVAEALARLGVRQATVVGHSMGGAIAVALAQRSPALVGRVAIIDTRSSPEDEGDLGLVAALGFAPVIGEALWRVKPDFAIRQGLEVAFAPGFDVPDAFVEDVKRMTYSAYDDSPTAFDEYSDEQSLADRVAATGKPLMVIMGAEEQIIDDPQASLSAYRESVPSARIELMPRVGHSPNVEAPAATAALVLAFARHEMQAPLQKRSAVRKRP